MRCLSRSNTHFENMECLDETLDKFEQAVDITLPKFKGQKIQAAAGGPIHP